MIPLEAPKDLIVLAADKSMQLAIKGVLARPAHQGFRRLSADVVAHVDRDPGILRQSHVFLRDQLRRYRYSIAVCDLEGSGSGASREGTEERIEENLRVNGWEERATAIVIEPELEIWMWGDWDALERCVGWHDSAGSLKSWLRGQKLLGATEAKPGRPKEALKRVLREVRKPWSSAIFEAMAAGANTNECVDGAFLKLKSTLRRWFPA